MGIAKWFSDLRLKVFSTYVKMRFFYVRGKNGVFYVYFFKHSSTIGAMALVFRSVQSKDGKPESELHSTNRSESRLYGRRRISTLRLRQIVSSSATRLYGVPFGRLGSAGSFRQSPNEELYRNVVEIVAQLHQSARNRRR